VKYVPAWFPGAGFQRHAQRAKADQRRLRDKPMEFVVSEIVSLFNTVPIINVLTMTLQAKGTALTSMVQFMLEEDSALPAEQSQAETIKDVAALAYLVGGDTTLGAVMSFFLAMLVHPEVQAKAQAEVDRVVGKDRLPELEDAENMPYVQAIANECLRWLPVVPTGLPFLRQQRSLALYEPHTGLPHSTTQDDEYNGYLIPKGSIVMGSVWSVFPTCTPCFIADRTPRSILHDPEDYPDPDTFKPERYLTPEGKLDPNVRDPRVACFGFGRRICPGRHLADASLFAMIATLLATVDLVRAKDAQGHEIVPDVEVTSGILSHAKPFPWDVRSRGPQAEALIANALVH
jgi:cytochrome P450